MSKHFFNQSLECDTADEAKILEGHWKATLLTLERFLKGTWAKNIPVSVTNLSWDRVERVVENERDEFQGLNIFLRINLAECFNITPVNFDIFHLDGKHFQNVPECYPWKCWKTDKCFLYSRHVDSLVELRKDNTLRYHSFKKFHYKDVGLKFASQTWPMLYEQASIRLAEGLTR